MSLISANGIVAVDIGLRLRETAGIKAYDYTLGYSSSPAMELTCDTSDGGAFNHDCRLDLFVHFTGFDRVVVRQKKIMNWAVSIPQDC